MLGTCSIGEIQQQQKITTVETPNLEVEGTCKHNSRQPEIDPSERSPRY